MYYIQLLNTMHTTQMQYAGHVITGSELVSPLISDIFIYTSVVCGNVQVARL